MSQETPAPARPESVAAESLAPDAATAVDPAAVGAPGAETATNAAVSPAQETTSGQAAVPGEQAVPAAPAPSVGHILRSAREARKLSVADVAQSLKLSTRQIDALEADDWSRLPGMTFVRGFARNYARLLQIDASALLAALDAERPAPEPVKLSLPPSDGGTLPQAGRPERRDLMAAVAAVLLVVGALAVYFLMPEGFRGEPKPAAVAEDAGAEPSSQAPAAAPEASPAAPGVPDANARAAGEVPANVATAAPATGASAPAMAVASAAPVSAPAAPATASAAPASAPAAAASAPAASGDAQLVFSFAQPAWVEVRDRSGQIVFSQLSPAGSERRVDGRPPFTLVVGNATHVVLRYKGKPVDMSNRSKDDVARLTLE